MARIKAHPLSVAPTTVYVNLALSREQADMLREALRAATRECSIRFRYVDDPATVAVEQEAWEALGQYLGTSIVDTLTRVA
jgi:hypothetical protein